MSIPLPVFSSYYYILLLFLSLFLLGHIACSECIDTTCSYRLVWPVNSHTHSQSQKWLDGLSSVHWIDKKCVTTTSGVLNCRGSVRSRQDVSACAFISPGPHKARLDCHAGSRRWQDLWPQLPHRSEAVRSQLAWAAEQGLHCQGSVCRGEFHRLPEDIVYSCFSQPIKTDIYITPCYRQISDDSCVGRLYETVLYETSTTTIITVWNSLVFSRLLPLVLYYSLHLL